MTRRSSKNLKDRISLCVDKVIQHSLDAPTRYRKSPIKGNVKRKVLPLGSMPIFFSRHSAQLIGRVLRFLSLWCPFRCRDGAHRFLRLQAGRLSTPGVAMHGPIGDSAPMAFFDCPGGHRVALRLACFEARA
jgi:hypothetical protein